MRGRTKSLQDSLMMSSNLEKPKSSKKIKNKFFGPYLLLQTIGEGEFAKVKLGLHRETGKEVAIKLVKKEWIDSKIKKAKIIREITSLRKVNHQNIVKLYDIIESENHIGLVLEYACGGELFEYIMKHQSLKDSEACRLFAQLVLAVSHLHLNKIVHRDLKLENLLLDSKRNIKVTDFGFANHFDEVHGELMITSCGSPCYAAPELVVSNGMYAGTMVDIWSIGVILYAMLAGYLPFDDDEDNPNGENINRLYKYILKTKLEYPSQINKNAQNLLERILVPDPTKRATLEEVRNHIWLAPYKHLFSEFDDFKNKTLVNENKKTKWADKSIQNNKEKKVEPNSNSNKENTKESETNKHDINEGTKRSIENNSEKSKKQSTSSLQKSRKNKLFSRISLLGSNKRQKKSNDNNVNTKPKSGSVSNVLKWISKKLNKANNDFEFKIIKQSDMRLVTEMNPDKLYQYILQTISGLGLTVENEYINSQESFNPNQDTSDDTLSLIAQKNQYRIKCIRPKMKKRTSNTSVFNCFSSKKNNNGILDMLMSLSVSSSKNISKSDFVENEKLIYGPEISKNSDKHDKVKVIIRICRVYDNTDKFTLEFTRSKGYISSFKFVCELITESLDLSHFVTNNKTENVETKQKKAHETLVDLKNDSESKIPTVEIEHKSNTNTMTRNSLETSNANEIKSLVSSTDASNTFIKSPATDSNTVNLSINTAIASIKQNKGAIDSQKDNIIKPIPNATVENQVGEKKVDLLQLDANNGQIKV
ncbi:hypothetical protein BB559_000399 [Furculomyces boomerangus]|uniref:Protein kinase domain-containing protein n=1 Tax=Furculomyces boomerangus TaxID=61424 RepID=A0A2T9Z5H1_9FUNG|nr:hypothetical protein BB559_000399 [Furculomyces boomerangus]